MIAISEEQHLDASSNSKDIPIINHHQHFITTANINKNVCHNNIITTTATGTDTSPITAKTTAIISVSANNLSLSPPTKKVIANTATIVNTTTTIFTSSNSTATSINTNAYNGHHHYNSDYMTTTATNGTGASGVGRVVSGTGNSQELHTALVPPDGSLWTALYDYEAQGEDELFLQRGQVVLVLSMDPNISGDEGWWIGKIGDKVINQ